MKLFTGSVAAAVLALSAASAQAQLLAPYEIGNSIGNSLAIKVSDVVWKA